MENGRILDFNTEKDKLLTDKLILRPSLGSLPPGGNWLSALPVGTYFTVKSKDRNNFMLLHLEVIRKTPNSVRLWDTFNNQPLGGALGDVCPDRFAGLFEFNEIIPKEEEQQDGTTHRLQGDQE